MKTVTVLYTPASSSLFPYIDGILDYYFIEAEKDSTIRLGVMTTPPGVREVRLESWKVEQGEQPWIKLKAKLRDTTVTIVEF